MPLTFGNTAGNLNAKWQNVALADVAASTVADFQFGFMAGRLLSDAVLKSESEARAHSVTVGTTAAIWFLAQKAAFHYVLHLRLT